MNNNLTYEEFLKLTEIEKTLYSTTFELNRYRKIIEEILSYIEKNKNNQDLDVIYEIIKKYCG